MVSQQFLSIEAFLIAAKYLCFKRGCHESSSSCCWISLTAQHLQTGVHRRLPFHGLTLKITQQDSGRIIDLEHDPLWAVVANLNNDWPLKSAHAGPLRSCEANSLDRTSCPAELFR